MYYKKIRNIYKLSSHAHHVTDFLYTNYTSFYTEAQSNRKKKQNENSLFEKNTLFSSLVQRFPDANARAINPREQLCVFHMCFGQLGDLYAIALIVLSSEIEKNCIDREKSHYKRFALMDNHINIACNLISISFNHDVVNDKKKDTKVYAIYNHHISISRLYTCIQWSI